MRYSCTSVGLSVETLLILDKIETFTLFNSAVQLFESSLADFCLLSSVDPQMSKTAQLYITPEAQILHRHCTVTTTGDTDITECSCWISEPTLLPSGQR